VCGGWLLFVAPACAKFKNSVRVNLSLFKRLKRIFNRHTKTTWPPAPQRCALPALDPSLKKRIGSGDLTVRVLKFGVLQHVASRHVLDFVPGAGFIDCVRT
jgi:hypothetical protein